jgi:sec-independent protein translocase protein TatA
VGSIGTGELLVALAILLVLFGGAKLPALARNLGQAQKEFKQGLKDGADSDDAKNDAPGTSGTA